MTTTAINSTREALATQLDSIVEKRPNDGKWFDVGADDRLVLIDRPEGCVALICEIAARFWQWLTSMFDDTPSALDKRIVLLTRGIDTYLEREQNIPERDRFLLKYTVALNELYRAAEKMGKVGKISAPCTRIVEEVAMGKREGSRAYTATWRLVHSPYSAVSGYSPNSDVQIVNRFANPQAKVSFEFKGELGSCKSLFKDSKPLGQNEESTTTAWLDGYFRNRNNTISVNARIENPVSIPVLDRNYQVDIDRCGNVTRKPAGEQATTKSVVIQFTNRGDRPIGVTTVPFGHGRESIYGTTVFKNPGESFQLNLETDSSRTNYDFTTLVDTAPATLTPGFNHGNYVCEVDAGGDLRVTAKHQ